MEEFELSPEEDAGDGKTVLEGLLEKHPEQAEANKDAFENCNDLPFLVDVDITGSHIEKAARSFTGGAGPSGVDGDQLSAMLLNYGSHSTDLREAFALSTRRLANSIVEWKELQAMSAKREIALSKTKGFRPIGIGESSTRIQGKTINVITGYDVKYECNVDQLSSGAKAGAEASVHLMKTLFDENSKNGWGLFLGDADNAFNRINRPAMLWNVRVFWPRCSRFLFNSYRGFAILLLKDSKQLIFILSKEGITQGDSLGMKVYGIGILPLTRKLKNTVKYTQNWFADDSACIGELQSLLIWIELLLEEGPKSGYYLQLEKCYCIVDPSYLEEANLLFSKKSIKIVTGSKYVGGYVGSEQDLDEWLSEKVMKWVKSVNCLASAAEQFPHSAHTVLTKSLQHEWGYIQRIIAGAETYVHPLKEVLMDIFLPKLTSLDLTSDEKDLMCKPVRHLGIGIVDPVFEAPLAFDNSQECTKMLTDAIRTGIVIDCDAYEHESNVKKQQARLLKNVKQQEAVVEILQELPEQQRNSVQRKLKMKCSTWLTIVPTQNNGFAMSSTQFRDALALRYGRTPTNLSTHCDADGEEFTVCHALNCKKGGLVTLRHNELRDLNIEMVKTAGFTHTVKEPMVKESDVKGEGV